MPVLVLMAVVLDSNAVWLTLPLSIARPVPFSANVDPAMVSVEAAPPSTPVRAR